MGDDRVAGDRRVTLDDLGAWLVKGNADHTDLAGRFGRDPAVDSWCVQRSYRLGLMAAGQPVVFWASGSRNRRLAYGVWGVGRLAGAAELSPDGRWRIPLVLSVWPPERWLRRAQLHADGRLADLEVFRLPQGSNPSYLTKDQFAALHDHLA